jgi:hypothetical protein
MTTLKITVDNQKNARFLSKILKNMNFVKKIEHEQVIEKNQYTKLKLLFNKVEKGELFSLINNPVEWQQEIRNEW